MQASLTHIIKAIQLLKDGCLVAIPTETVYGIAADATNDLAIAKIFEAKKRPSFNPLIIHFPDLYRLEKEAYIDERVITLAKEFWPGPLTLVLKRREDSKVSYLATTGLDTMAVRIPFHPLTLEILRGLDFPLAAPSANVSSTLSPTIAKHVEENFQDNPLVSMIVDGGPCSVGLESTVLDLTVDTPCVLRPGKITVKDLEPFLGKVSYSFENPNQPKSPGQLLRHYAPKTRVRINALDPHPDEALLAFGPDVPQGAKKTLNLSPTGDLIEAASHLFLMLHQLDDPTFSSIAVMPIPHTSLGIAINDRLQRAATSFDLPLS
jgi:L-threonylcarbamoyladenylate synthase